MVLFNVQERMMLEYREAHANSALNLQVLVFCSILASIETNGDVFFFNSFHLSPYDPLYHP